MARVRTRKRGDTYSYIFEAGKVNGKRKVIEKGGFASEDEAYDAGVAAYSDWKHGNIGITSNRITLQDYLASWLKVMESTVGPSTIVLYASRIKVINSYLGDIQLQELRPRDVDRMVLSMRDSGSAYSTIALTKTVLHNALQYAVYPAELIAANPADAIKVPRSAPRNVVPRQVITPEKLEAMVRKYPFGHHVHIPFMLAYYTGMRAGEVLGLAWEDIDLERGTLCIRQQLGYINGTGIVLSPPKTSSSNRLIMIDSKLLALLKRWKAHQKAVEMQMGGSYCHILVDEHHALHNISKGLPVPRGLRRVSLVCTHEDGRYVTKDCLFYATRREGINMHSFRHTHATLLAENGAPPKDVAARLGHKNVNVTLNTYTHVTDNMRKNTRDIIESLNEKDADKGPMQTECRQIN
jgi:integrase